MEKLGIKFDGITLRRELCYSGLSVLGDTFVADSSAQVTLSDCEHFRRLLRIEATRSYFIHIALIAITPDKT